MKTRQPFFYCIRKYKTPYHGAWRLSCTEGAFSHLKLTSILYRMVETSQATKNRLGMFILTVSREVAFVS
jgi:hypothetical protein